MRFVGIAVLILLCVSICCADTYITTPHYIFTDLGRTGTPQAINNRGQIAMLGGYVWSPDMPNGSTGKYKHLGYGPQYDPTEFSPFTGASDINDFGVVVGGTGTMVTMTDGSNPTSPFCTSPNGVIESDSILGYPFSGDAVAVNDSGFVVGYREGFHDQPDQALFWDATGKRTILPTPHPEESCRASDINDYGVVVGYCDNYKRRNAALWKNGKVKELGLGQANALNDFGVVVGWSSDCACKWFNGKMTRLDKPGTGSSEALDINDAGHIVGWYKDEHTYWDKMRAYLWIEGEAFDLNEMATTPDGWVLLKATATNDKGQIVGGCKTDDDIRHSFLLTPVDSN